MNKKMEEITNYNGTKKSMEVLASSEKEAKFAIEHHKWLISKGKILGTSIIDPNNASIFFR